MLPAADTPSRARMLWPRKSRRRWFSSRKASWLVHIADLYRYTVKVLTSASPHLFMVHVTHSAIRLQTNAFHAKGMIILSFIPIKYDIQSETQKPGKKDIYQRLQSQCTNMSIPSLPSSKASDNPIPELNNALSASDVILDAIFGFSFSPPVRTPFDAVLPLLARSKLPMVSVDIPSGWDVEKGKIPFPVKDIDQSQDDEGEKEFEGLEPDVLVSLTAPKAGAKEFKGRHFLGGRFVSK